MNSYKRGHRKGIKRHLEFYRRAVPIIKKNSSVFVHGGIEPGIPVEENTRDFVMWDRSLVKRAWRWKNEWCGMKRNITGFDEVFVGHTATNFFKKDCFEPLKLCEVWMLDTGAGWDGKLTVMDVETKEYWQSDFVSDLYFNPYHNSERGYVHDEEDK